MSGFLGNAVGGLLGGAVGLIGTQMTNAANAKQAAAQQAFQAQQAEIARNFEAQQALNAIQAQYNGQNFAAANNENMMYAAHRLNMEGVANAQDFARDMAQRQTNTQWDMFHESQNYMRDMSNTSYQRAVADMKAAGINPMLAYVQGGAGTPQSSGGSGATGSAPAATATPLGVSGVSGAKGTGHAAQGARALIQDMLKPAFSTAMQGAQFALGLEQMAANIDKTRADAFAAYAEAKTGLQRPANVAADTNLRHMQADVAHGQATALTHQPALIQAQTAQAGAQASSAAATARLENLRGDRFSRSGDSPLGNMADSAVQGSKHIFNRIVEGLGNLRRLVQ